MSDFIIGINVKKNRKRRACHSVKMLFIGSSGCCCPIAFIITKGNVISMLSQLIFNDTINNIFGILLYFHRTEIYTIHLIGSKIVESIDTMVAFCTIKHNYLRFIHRTRAYLTVIQSLKGIGKIINTGNHKIIGC